MPSTFTWLDYSEHDRRKMVDVISAFREQGTRDELGIGTIRDGFADILFPGTGTVQTRAFYFLFIPWMYQALERKKVESAKATEWARGQETRLIYALEESGHTRGNIGREARDKLKRLPSNIYWQGLGAWGIRKFSGSQAQYHRSLDRFYLTKGQMLRSDDKDIVAGFCDPNWHTGLPEQPDNFPSEATFELRSTDSEYLRGRILATVGSSLLAHLVRQDSPPSDQAFIWESEFYGGFPSDIQSCVDHSRCFSETIHGAALLYNLMLAELSRQEESIETYREAIEGWADMIANRRPAIAAWNYDDFWGVLDKAGTRVPKRTRQFVLHWLERSLSLDDQRGISDDTELRDLIHNRERKLKRGQARLDNPRALELWSGAAGTGRLDFRWGTSRDILTDIIEGFENA
jgi:hypothetical protein